MYTFTGKTKALYKVLNGMGYKPYEITEAAAGTTYQYVAQCSNRGSCDASTGLCKCFKGYSNDNCDTQNMLAA
jgi:ABC-type proline/glycine betaine transport system substrate-binding protein